MVAHAKILLFVLCELLLATLGVFSQRCENNLKNLWTIEVGHSPFAAEPVIIDVDANGEDDIVAATFHDSVSLIKFFRERGRQLQPKLQWQHKLIDSSLHAQPLMHDTNADGFMDILICTTDGHIYSLDQNGRHIPDKDFQVSALSMKADWYEGGSFSSQIATSQDGSSIALDSHIMATPVIADVNADGVTEELILPVSYFFYPLSQREKNITEANADVIASSLVVLNLTDFTTITNIYLDYSRKQTDQPSYLFYSPVLVDVDGKHGDLELVVGTFGGHLYVFNSDGSMRDGFPSKFSRILCQVMVEDVTGDGQLDILVVAGDVTVHCLDITGREIWRRELSGTSTGGVRLGDVDQDGQMDVVIASDAGSLWVLNGRSGEILPGWPFKVGQKMVAAPVIAHLRATSGPPDIVIAAENGLLYMVSGTMQCRTTFHVGETSFVNLLTSDISPLNPGAELMMATTDGTILVLGSANNEACRDTLDVQAKVSPEEVLALKFNPVKGWPASVGNVFSNASKGVAIMNGLQRSAPVDFSGRSFHLELHLADSDPKAATYIAQIVFGSKTLKRRRLSRPGRHIIQVHSPWEPSHGHLTVFVSNRYGQVFSDTIAVRFNLSFIEDLQWLLFTPSVVMLIILLIRHGFPPVDLLPFTDKMKGR